MKMLIAVVLVISTLVSAQQPNRAPYEPRGFKPSGPEFHLPVKARNLNGTPSTIYGPPLAQEYGPPPEEKSTVTTTEIPTTTEADTEPTTLEPQAERIKLPSRSQKLTEPNIEEQEETEVEPAYVVLPEKSKLVYLTPVKLVKGDTVKKSAKIVQEPRLAVPLQAIPAFAKLQAQTQPQIEAEVEPVLLAKYQKSQVVQFEQLQAVPALGASSAYTQSQLWSPYSSSFYQIYQ